MKRPAQLEQYPGPVDWWEWRKCSVCGVVTGQACRSRSSRVVDGQPDGQPYALPEPHTLRRPRVRGGMAMPLIRAERFARGGAGSGAVIRPAAR